MTAARSLSPLAYRDNIPLPSCTLVLDQWPECLEALVQSACQSFDALGTGSLDTEGTSAAMLLVWAVKKALGGKVQDEDK